MKNKQQKISINYLTIVVRGLCETRLLTSKFGMSYDKHHCGIDNLFRNVSDQKTCLHSGDWVVNFMMGIIIELRA